MTTAGQIGGFTDQLVRDCGLTSTSILLFDRSGGQEQVSYLHHTGVTDEAQHIYAQQWVFLSDPFAHTSQAANGFILWGEPLIDPLLTEAKSYRGFLMQHDIDVVGAWCKRLTPNLSLVIGTHRNRVGAPAAHLQIPLLQLRLAELSAMVVEHLFTEVMASSAGLIALHTAVPTHMTQGAAPLRLSDRESEISALICRGKQNKQVAWDLGISEFTVENHLRRIYRKLGIHSRAALVAHFSRRVH